MPEVKQELLRSPAPHLVKYIGLPDGQEICICCWNDREFLARMDRETEEEIEEARKERLELENPCRTPTTDLTSAAEPPRK